MTRLGDMAMDTYKHFLLPLSSRRGRQLPGPRHIFGFVHNVKFWRASERAGDRRMRARSPRCCCHRRESCCWRRREKPCCRRRCRPPVTRRTTHGRAGEVRWLRNIESLSPSDLVELNENCNHLGWGQNVPGQVRRSQSNVHVQDMGVSHKMNEGVALRLAQGVVDDLLVMKSNHRISI